jgi:hypothetical protein
VLIILSRTCDLEKLPAWWYKNNKKNHCPKYDKYDVFADAMIRKIYPSRRRRRWNLFMKKILFFHFASNVVVHVELSLSMVGVLLLVVELVMAAAVRAEPSISFINSRSQASSFSRSESW